MTTDWLDWHDSYADPATPLARRLRIVQQRLSEWLDEHPDRPLTVVSMCAGQGRDLLEVLAAREDADRVRATLIEFDPRNAALARAASAGLPGVTVRKGDAGDPESYRDAVPADLVLMAGVLGNITDHDVRATIAALPQFCAMGATVIWTRTRAEPDLTPAIRGWLADAGFAERSFDAPEDLLVTVGVHAFTGVPQPLTVRGTIFRFVR